MRAFFVRTTHYVEMSNFSLAMKMSPLACSGVTLPFGAPADFFAAPTKNLVSKKRSPLFFGFSYRLLAPLELFVPPNILFACRLNAKLAEIWSILLPKVSVKQIYLVDAHFSRTIFRLKNSKFGNMPPPA